ncbi:MAG: NUDIX domain-containing protein [Puniceicoccaceae bacterium]|nr:MAG: NUDIX domain-containing protein [Puniceicoccaceae bacterium]
MTDANGELWDIYDASGKKQGRTIQRGHTLQPGEYHLVVQVWPRDSAGRFLIQKRPQHLKYLPGRWAATGGSVLAGETSRQGAVRELAEELGWTVQPEDLTCILEERSGNALSSAWLLECDLPVAEVVLQTEEVEEVRWASSAEIRGMVEDGRFYDYGKAYFDAVLGKAD